MSGTGPTGDDNPFDGLPFFGDLAKLFGGGLFGGGALGSGSGGPLQWDTARQMAMQLAAGGESEPNIDPVHRLDVEQLARVADLHVARMTGLATSVTGRSVTVVPVTRTQWVQRSLDAYKPLFDALGSSLGAPTPPEPDPADPADPFSAMLTQLMGAMAPMMLGVTAGGMIGHLAQRSFGQYDLPVPRAPSDELLLVWPNVTGFAQDWSIDEKDLVLWLCLHEITHHAVLGVSHIRSELESLLRAYGEGFEPDAGSLVDRLESVDLQDPAALGNLQSLLGDPEMVFGAIQSDQQRAMLPRIEALVALIVGYVDHVMDQVGTGLISSYGMITEAVRRRRVEADESDQFVSRLLGLRTEQTLYDTGAAFVDGVVERAGFDALDPLWTDVRYLPTPAEITAPGLWLARIEIPLED